MGDVNGRCQIAPMMESTVDKGWAWMIVLGNFVSLFVMAGITKSFGILMVEFVGYFDIPVALAASIMGVSSAVYTVAAPLSVSAGEHFSQRTLVMLGGLAGGLGLCLSGLLFNIEWVIFTIGTMMGFGNASVYGNGLVMIGRYFDKKRSLASGLALSGSGIGLFAIPPLLQLLLDTYGLRGTLMIAGGLYLHIVPCGLLYRPLPPYAYNKANNAEEDTLTTIEDIQNKTGEYDLEMEKTSDCIDKSGNDDSGEMQKLIGQNDVKQLHDNDGLSPSETRVQRFKQLLKAVVDISVFKSYLVCAFIATTFLVFFGNFNFSLFMPAAAISRGIEKYHKAWLVSINGLCDIVGRLAMGVLGDLNILRKYKLMALASLFYGIAILCFSFADRFWIMCICVSLYGFFTAGYFTIYVPTIIELFGLKLMPKILATVLFFQGVGVAIGQPTLGAIRDATGSYQIVHIVNAVFIFVGATGMFLYPLVQKLEKKRQAELKESD